MWRLLTQLGRILTGQHDATVRPEPAEKEMTKPEAPNVLPIHLMRRDRLARPIDTETEWLRERIRSLEEGEARDRARGDDVPVTPATSDDVAEARDADDAAELERMTQTEPSPHSIHSPMFGAQRVYCDEHDVGHILAVDGHVLSSFHPGHAWDPKNAWFDPESATGTVCRRCELPRAAHPSEEALSEIIAGRGHLGIDDPIYVMYRKRLSAIMAGKPTRVAGAYRHPKTPASSPHRHIRRWSP